MQSQKIVVKPANTGRSIHLRANWQGKKAENDETEAKSYGLTPELKSKHLSLRVFYRPV